MSDWHDPTMATRDEFIREVGVFLGLPKELAGIDFPPHWLPARDGIGIEAKFPVACDGTQLGDRLTVVAVPATRSFHINLLHVGMCVSRLDFDPMQPHPNTMFAGQDGLPSMVSGHHFHRWSINTRFIKGDGTTELLKHAEELPTTVRTFDQALRWFCHEVNIALPHGHLVDYPGVLL